MANCSFTTGYPLFQGIKEDMSHGGHEISASPGILMDAFLMISAGKARNAEWKRAGQAQIMIS